MATSVTGLGPGFCPVDGVPLLLRRPGNPPTFCSARCRKRAQRARREAEALARQPQPVPVRPAGPSGVTLRGRTAPAPQLWRALGAPGRLPARRELVPRRSAAPATGRQDALAVMLAAGGYAVDPKAGRGMCVIVTITGRYEELPCGLPAHPEHRGLCAHHLGVVRRLA
jgi:hypothetical protein